MHRARHGLVALALGLVVLACVAAPASAARHHGHARVAVKFGADLTTNTQPSNSNPPHTCHHEDSALTTDPCTWMMVTSQVGSPGGNLKAPSNGTIKAIWLIAGHAGKLRPVVGFLNGVSGGSGNGKITAHGPMLSYASSITPGGTYTVQKFPGLNIPVKKGEVLGFNARRTSALRCDSGGTKTLLFQPRLVVGASPVASAGDSGCSILIEAVMVS